MLNLRHFICVFVHEILFFSTTVDFRAMSRNDLFLVKYDNCLSNCQFLQQLKKKQKLLPLFKIFINEKNQWVRAEYEKVAMNNANLRKRAQSSSSSSYVKTEFCVFIND